MKNISGVTRCYGCLACVQRCPVKCISVTETLLGHSIPTVDEVKCINCGACLRVCPDVVENDFNRPIKTIAAWEKDANQRKLSSSGAIATLLAEDMVNKGGVVYGCSFTQPFGFKHVRCESLEAISMLRGSKYVQSSIQDCYRLIADDIKDHRQVLFVGTPCQVAAVKNFIGCKHNLFLVDIICHGVPSCKLLKESLPSRFLEGAVTNVSFRDSTQYQFHIYDGGKELYSRRIKDDLYLKAFFTGLDYRDSCYKCAFAQENRISDITLGDFWGIDEEIRIEFNVDAISVCLVNSEKGNSLLKKIEARSEQIERPVSEAIQGNAQLRHPKAKTFRTKLFNILYPRVGFKAATILSIPEIYIKSRLMK